MPVWQLALAPAINGVVVPGLPIPFPMLWQMMGVVLTSIIIAVVFAIDRRQEAEAGQEALHPGKLVDCLGPRNLLPVDS